MYKRLDIITSATTSKHNTEKDDEALGTILRGVETRMSENILSIMYGAIRINDESTDEYYAV